MNEPNSFKLAKSQMNGIRGGLTCTVYIDGREFTHDEFPDDIGPVKHKLHFRKNTERMQRFSVCNCWSWGSTINIGASSFKHA